MYIIILPTIVPYTPLQKFNSYPKMRVVNNCYGINSL